MLNTTYYILHPTSYILNTLCTRTRIQGKLPLDTMTGCLDLRLDSATGKHDDDSGPRGKDPRE